MKFKGKLGLIRYNIAEDRLVDGEVDGKVDGEGSLRGDPGTRGRMDRYGRITEG